MSSTSASTVCANGWRQERRRRKEEKKLKREKVRMPVEQDYAVIVSQLNDVVSEKGHGGCHRAMGQAWNYIRCRAS